jgi:competence protein ComEA
MEEEDVSPPPPSFFQKFGLALVLGGISVFCIIASLILLFKTTQTTEPIRFSDSESSGSARTSEILVDIEGAVVKPGVYTLPNGSRIDDLLSLAGGLTDTADTVWVGKTLNKAALLLDGGKLFIPTKGEVSSSQSLNKESVAGAVSSVNSLISINSASAKELDTLPGVGEVTAQKIIAGRPYQTIDELLSRKIVGQSVFEKIRSLLTL